MTVTLFQRKEGKGLLAMTWSDVGREVFWPCAKKLLEGNMTLHKHQQ